MNPHTLYTPIRRTQSAGVPDSYLPYIRESIRIVGMADCGEQIDPRRAEYLPYMKVIVALSQALRSASPA